MLVETQNMITAEDFRRDLDKYIAVARAGNGPVALMQGSEVVGFLVSPDEYEAMFGIAVKAADAPQ